MGIVNRNNILELEAECRRLRLENSRLKDLLNITATESSETSSEPNARNALNILKDNSLSIDEKIKIYRSLFRGRDDVYATRWESKGGQAGYSPACSYEWDRRFCNKPKIKCNECANRQLLPITDQTIHAHLTGRKFIGIYPLLKDETCYFLAIDFDKTSWQQDVLAFFKICCSFSIPSLLERSQSGNGAHAWIFFAEAIPARLARTLGTGLLTRTMQEHHTVSMDSYDRLFPNQDTIPQGGFGNLIALPLQGNRRKQGNSTFLNDKLEIDPDPWRLLSQICPITERAVTNIIGLISKNGDLLDVRHAQIEEENLDPWVTPQSNNKYPQIQDTFPKSVSIALANLLYVPTRGLPAILINQIKKIAAFQNPEFYRFQAMRLSTYGKPRVINCSEEFPGYLGLPRGCETELLDLLHHYDIKTTMNDETIDGEKVNVSFNAELTPEQEKAYSTILQYRYGILAATTAFGKTVIAAKIIAKRQTNTLILVHRQQLLEQWKERLSSLFDISSDFIGTLGGGRKKLSGSIDIAMLQSLFKQGIVSDDILKYGQIIVDECHHLSAFSFEQVLKKARARYILGLTATPLRKDGHHPIIMMQCGAIRYNVSSKSQITASKIQHRAFVQNTYCRYPALGASYKISDLYYCLVQDESRNKLILNNIVSALENNRVSLLLTQRTQHLQWFADRLSSYTKNVFILQGRMKRLERQEVFQKIKSLPDNEKRIILATGSYIGEGFDDPRLDTLFLALPVSWQGTLQQYVGRLHRTHQHKKDVFVYDYVDIEIPMLVRMYQKRLKKYQAMGYTIEDNKIT